MVSRSIVIAIAVIIIIIVGAILYVYLYGPLAPRPGGVSKDRIVVGFTVALSGPLSAQGTEQLRAYQICADYINSQRGIYVAELGKRLPINLTYYDDSSDASKARSLYEKLVAEDRVDFLWPPFGTGIGLGINL